MSSKIDELKQVLKNVEDKLDQERVNNLDRLTCKNCTFEDNYNIPCISCSRDFINKIIKLINKLTSTKDNWIDISKHDSSNYFDSR